MNAAVTNRPGPMRKRRLVLRPGPPESPADIFDPDSLNRVQAKRRQPVIALVMSAVDVCQPCAQMRLGAVD
jgi:hypothetical protein